MRAETGGGGGDDDNHEEGEEEGPREGLLPGLATPTGAAARGDAVGNQRDGEDGDDGGMAGSHGRRAEFKPKGEAAATAPPVKPVGGGGSNGRLDDRARSGCGEAVAAEGGACAARRPNR